MAPAVRSRPGLPLTLLRVFRRSTSPRNVRAEDLNGNEAEQRAATQRETQREKRG